MSTLRRPYGRLAAALFIVQTVPSGCSNSAPEADGGVTYHSEALLELPLQTCTTSVSVNDDTREVVEESPFCELQKGKAQWVCGDGSRETIEKITPFNLIRRGSEQCRQGRSEVRPAIQYEGEIDLSFLQLLENLEAQFFSSDEHYALMCESGSEGWCEKETFEPAIFVNSPGGDAVAAIDAARILARRDWTLIVDDDAQCASACVFLAAGAKERLLLGELAIHRIYPVGSSASSRGELNDQLAKITGDARELLRENGVSARLIDDMMTTPSSNVHILTPAELNAYGMGRENSAQKDLERVSTERKCGADFAERLIKAEALDDQCGGNQGSGNMDGFWRYARCKNEGLERLGFPNEVCPTDGPQYTCPAPNTQSGMRFSYEPCD